MTTLSPDQRTLVLLHGDTAPMPAGLLAAMDRGTVLVAASSRLRLALAPLLVPGAEIIWTDFRCSASIRSLRAVVQGGGGLDRLVLVEGREGDGRAAEGSVFAHLSTILTLLPALRRGRGGGNPALPCRQPRRTVCPRLP